MKKFVGLLLLFGIAGAGVFYFTKKEVSLITDSEHDFEEEDTPFTPDTPSVEPMVQNPGSPEARPAPTETVDLGDKKQKIESVITNMGIEKRFENNYNKMMRQFEGSFKDGKGQGLEDNRLIKELQNFLEPEKLMKDFSKRLAKEFSSEELVKLETLLKDPDYQEFIELEEQVSDENYLETHKEEFAEFFKNQKTDPRASPERQKLIEDFDKASGISEAVTSVTFDTMKNFGFLKGQDTEKVKKDMTAGITKEVRAGYLFSTRDKSSETLKRIVEVSQDPIMARNNKLYQDMNKESAKKFETSALKELSKGTPKHDETSQQ
jgi:hypothetical protein